MPFTEDLTVFFDTDDFATDVSITLSGDNNRVLTVSTIFEEPSSLADFGNYIITSTNPSLLLEQTADTVLIKAGDAVAINGMSYVVDRPPISDGTGVARLYITNSQSQDRAGDTIPDPFGGF